MRIVGLTLTAAWLGLAAGGAPERETAKKKPQ